jgi:hypothetical protein
LRKRKKARLDEAIDKGTLSPYEIANRKTKLALLNRQLKIVARMKKKRDKFEHVSIARIKAYTRLELKLLARAVNVLRMKLHLMPYKGGILDLRLKSWCGAGSIAGALIRKFNLKENHYAEDISVRDLPPWQVASHHAFFGGNIQMLKMGYLSSTTLYGYDIASAYPWGMTLFPSMKGGKWTHLVPSNSASDLRQEAPFPGFTALPAEPKHTCAKGDISSFNKARSLKELRALIEKTNILSMFKIYFVLPRKDGNKWVPWFPLPYRVPKTKAILFPYAGYGWYMRDDLLALIAWLEGFCPTWPRAGRNGEAKLTFEQAFLFAPALPGLSDCENPAPAPYAFIPELYEERRRIKSLPYYDLMELIIKLGALNSLYGKIAQKVGGNFDEPPPGACPYYAAATTAACRRRLIEAAMLDPHAIIFFATDGILATRPLKGLPRLKMPGDRIELGDWEFFEANRGLFIQAGVYHYWKKVIKDDGTIEWKPVTKTRGGDPKKYHCRKLSWKRGAVQDMWQMGGKGRAVVRWFMGAWSQAHN